MDLIETVKTNNHRGEAFRFLLVGGVSVFIDYSFYHGLNYFDILEPNWAKRCSFVLGSIWAFGMNKFYTFKQKEIRNKEPYLFALVYLLGFGINSGLHDLLYHFLNNKLIAFLGATSASTVSNFIGQKFIVFRV